MLSNLFDGFVGEELRALRRALPGANHLFNQMNTSRNPFIGLQGPSDSFTSATSRSAVSAIITSSSIVPAVIPDMSLFSSHKRSVSMRTSFVPLAGLNDTQLPTIPQSPKTAIETPTPRPRQTADTPTLLKGNFSKEGDYFSMKTKRISGTPTTPDDFSGWGGPSTKSKDFETTGQQTPSTPSSGGFMGRLRQLGKSSKRISSDDTTGVAELATTPYNSDRDKGFKVSGFYYDIGRADLLQMLRTTHQVRTKRQSRLDS